jgi:hypothetical protein
VDQLDPGLSQRPSRFDRKYFFPLPSEKERAQYCEYWRSKLAKKHASIEFPSQLCPAIASITDGFSFAYLKEAFVTTLLIIANKRTDTILLQTGVAQTEDADLEKYELWREIKKQIELLRHEMGKGESDMGSKARNAVDAFGMFEQPYLPPGPILSYDAPAGLAHLTDSASFVFNQNPEHPQNP